MNIVNYLQNPETRNATVRELKEVLKLWENHVSHEEMINVIKSIYEWESTTLNTINFKRTKELKNKLLSSNSELFSLWENIWYDQRKLLKDYAEKLRTKTLPELESKLTQAIWDIPIENGFPSISARAKSADWITDKIWRMKSWNDWKSPRLDYNLADMPDAVWWRIAVTDIKQLQEITKKLENIFWKENIFEVDNFYTSSKKDNPYRVITYTALVDWVPCEIQLTTLKSSLVADLWHNTWYKKLHQLPEDVIEKLANLQRQTTLHEHSLIK
jgi:ppGpp synthetase/RelA/SpoT-type nucleotidyltranferase